MRVVIVYESLFGNTREVAEAIADGVGEAHPDAEIDCVRADEAAPERVGSPDLLVVGGPTHMRGMSSGLSRKMGLRVEKQEAAEMAPHRDPVPGAEGPGVRGWFHALPKAGHGTHAAAFDTRADIRMAGGAANSIARKLRGHGYELVAEPEGFVIEDTEGPLRQGEHNRAKAWGMALN